MTNHRWIAAMVLLGAATASAQTVPPGQQPAPPSTQPPTQTLSPRVGTIDFGVRGNTGEGDPARYQRFRDLRDGAVLDVLRYARETAEWAFDAAFDHVGYRDQHYLAQFERFGRLSVSFDWNQIPLFYSGDTRTPYTRDREGVLRLPDALQGAAQNGAASFPDFGRSAGQFDARQRRDIADARLHYVINRNTDLRARFTSTRKTGEQPWGASFGFSADVELPLPLDHRTNDVNAAIEWANSRGLAKLAYDGSFFNNDIQQIVWDNPLRLTDTTNSTAYSTGLGTSQGRMSIWPSSTAHTVSAMGSVRLPGRSRGHAYVSLGSWNQNEPLLPHTINTAIPTIPLPRASAEADARIVAANLGWNARPTNAVWLNARFRLYDYDNRTPEFHAPEYVRLDQAIAVLPLGGSEPFEYTRHFIDLDASFTPLTFVAFRVGYGREHDDRSFRFLEQTTENTFRASIDSTTLSWFSVRAMYEYSKRTGEGFDEEAFSDIGEQVSLRQFDISDRNRTRLSTVFQVMPIEQVGFTAQIGVGSDDRPDAALGLQDNDHRFFNVGVDVTPGEDVLVGASYGRENYDTLQRSRQANPGPQFDDPTRDWSTDMDEHVDTFTANLDLPRLAPRTAVRFAYDFNRSRSQYLYLLAPNSTLTPPEQLPPVRNQLHRSQADLIYDLTRNLALGFSYWYDRYHVDDFAYEALTAPLGFAGSGLFLGYQYRDYTAHTGWVRLIVNW